MKLMVTAIAVITSIWAAAAVRLDKGLVELFTKGGKTQLDRFKQVARELGADEEEARWDERLRKVAGHKANAGVREAGVRKAALLAFLALSACATTRSPPRTNQEVLEGNAANYPAFLAAAQGCGFSAFEPKGDGMGGTHYLVSFPYRMDAPSLCVVRWVEQNPQMGLVLSGH